MSPDGALAVAAVAGVLAGVGAFGARPARRLLARRPRPGAVVVAPDAVPSPWVSMPGLSTSGVSGSPLPGSGGSMPGPTLDRAVTVLPGAVRPAGTVPADGVEVPVTPPPPPPAPVVPPVVVAPAAEPPGVSAPPVLVPVPPASAPAVFTPPVPVPPVFVPPVLAPPVLAPPAASPPAIGDDLVFSGFGGSGPVDIDFAPELPALPDLPAPPSFLPGISLPEPAPEPAPEPPAAERDEPRGPARTAPRKRSATRRQRALLTGLADRLQAVDGRREVAEAAMQEAAVLVHADAVALVVRSIHGPRVLWQHPGGPDAEDLWGARTLAALLARSRPVRLAVEGDPLAGGGRTALLTAPVPAGGGSVGVVVARRRDTAFSGPDEDALARLARVCGARLHRTAERAAATAVATTGEPAAVDGVTGLGSRDLLVADLVHTLAEQPVHGLPTALVVAEVVGLARLRTDQGPDAADAAAGAAAVAVAARLRIGDLLYRIGPDELAVLLPATDVAGAAAVSRRLGAAPVGDGVSLRAVAVPVEESPDAVMARLERELGEARQRRGGVSPTGVV